MNQYRVQLFGRGHLTFETSRGCAFRCSYCYNTKVYSSTWRSLTPDETITRLKRLVKETGAKGIIFSDDNFFGNKDRALEILLRIKQEGLDISLPKIDGHISVLAQLKDSELQLMRESGCRMVQIGVESAAPRMQELLNKDFSVSDLAEFNRRLAKFDILPAYYFMVGYPTETIEEIAQTMAFFLRLPRENKNAVPRLNIYTPFPGTGMYEHCVKNGFRPPESLEGWVSLNYRTVGRRSPWITEERRKILRMLDFTAMLASRNNFMNSYKQTGPLVKLVAALYYPIAKWRVEKLFHQFPVERKIAEYLGLYPKQNAAE